MFPCFYQSGGKLTHNFMSWLRVTPATFVRYWYLVVPTSASSPRSPDGMIVAIRGHKGVGAGGLPRNPRRGLVGGGYIAYFGP